MRRTASNRRRERNWCAFRKGPIRLAASAIFANVVDEEDLLLRNASGLTLIAAPKYLKSRLARAERHTNKFAPREAANKREC